MNVESFDPQHLHQVLDTERRKQGLSWRGVAKALAIAPSTLTRLGQGQNPSVALLVRMVAWAGSDARKFLNTARAPGTPEYERGYTDGYAAGLVAGQQRERKRIFFLIRHGDPT